MAIPNGARVVVTGGGSGLGRAFCEVLARRGARILVSDLKLADAQATAALCAPAEAHAFVCDVAQLSDVEALAREADRVLGGADVIVNNAGVAVAGVVGEAKIEDWRWVMNINLFGVIHGCHVFAPRFKAQNAGHIVNIASAAGLLTPPGLGPYNVAKAGVIALSETLFGEFAGTGVGVTVACPTFFQTNLMTGSRGPADTSKMAARMMAASKLSAEDVATAILDGANAGELHVIPQADGRWMWRFKRAAPQRFHELSPKVIKAITKRRK